MDVRRLGPGEVTTLRRLRLQALAGAPDAFGSTYEREEGRSNEDWQRWYTGGAVFVAEDAGRNPVGLAAGVRDTADPAAAYLTAMWVDPASRGTGAADALVEAVIAWAASEDIPVVRLYVLERNERARRLYARRGFRPTGVQHTRERDSAVELQMQRG